MIRAAQIRELFYFLCTFFGEWVFGFVPLPSPVEEKAITATIDYLDTLIITGDPEFWSRTEVYLNEQLEQLGSALLRQEFLLRVIGDRFDPAVLAGTLSSTPQ